MNIKRHRKQPETGAANALPKEHKVPNKQASTTGHLQDCTSPLSLISYPGIYSTQPVGQSTWATAAFAPHFPVGYNHNHRQWVAGCKHLGWGKRGYNPAKNPPH